MKRRLPLVGVLSCRKLRANGTTYSRVNDHLTASLIDHAGVAAVLLHTERPEHAADILPRLDGLVLPGSGSYVHPERYGGNAPVPEREYDPARDETAAELLRKADLTPELPVLASCRGMQELAVHAGGALADVSESNVEHRLSVGEGHDDRWEPAHALHIEPGGILSGLIGDESSPRVNSQHSNRVTKLPGTVRVEAVAPDGVIEAISLDAPRRFVLGVQWHFEHHTERSRLDQRILAAFGSRCRERATEGGRA